MMELLEPALSIYKKQVNAKYVFGPLYVFSIDPGYSNLGYCYAAIVVETGTKQPIIYVDKQRFRTMNIANMAESKLDDLIHHCSSFFWKVFPNEMDLKKAVVLFERQYFSERSTHKRVGLATAGHRMVILESILSTIVKAKYQCLTVQISPNTIKSFFGTMKGAHKENKVAAMNYCTKQFGLTEEYCAKIGIKLNDHMADALLQVYHYAIEQCKLLDKLMLPPILKFIDSDKMNHL